MKIIRRVFDFKGTPILFTAFAILFVLEGKIKPIESLELNNKYYMEHVTDITIPVNGNEIQYRVLFHDEIYTFEPVNTDTSVSSFNIRRHHNEWIPESSNDDPVLKMAIKKLDEFLLSQH